MVSTSNAARLAGVLVAASSVVACGSESHRATTAAAAATVPATPPGSSGGASTTGSYAPTGAYTLKGATAQLRHKTITATGTDQSGVLVERSGVLTLLDSTVRTSGNSKSSDASSFYGLNAGVLARSGGTVKMAGGSVRTTGAGANGLFAYGSGASLSVANATITATGQYAHGAMTSGGGAVKLDNVTISTAGASSAAIATDRGGGTITVRGGKMTTSGYRSPGIYSTGTIIVRGARMSATAAEAAVVEGANSITVAGTSLTAGEDRGVMLYQSMSGDASAGTASYTMIGGSLTASQGPAFYVTNTRAAINLSAGARVSAASGTLLRADSAGTGSGNTGAGVATLRMSRVRLMGNLLTGGSGTISATLANGATLTGTINKAALALDGTSVWKVTGNSTLTTFSDTAAISGDSIKNVIGNGHTVTYDSSLSANKLLGGKTYRLSGGGTLTPA
jgi:hypothetical protein